MGTLAILIDANKKTYIETSHDQETVALNTQPNGAYISYDSDKN